MTLLASVNRLRRMLREDTVTATSSSDLLDQTIIDALNTAADEHLNTFEWSFLLRHDAQVWFPGLREESTGCSPTFNSTTLPLNDGSNSWDAADVQNFTFKATQEGRLLARVRVTGGAGSGTYDDTPDSAYPVDELYGTGAFNATLRNPFRGDTASSAAAGFQIFTHEYALPDTVRTVVSVRHQETPIRLEFMDKGESFDRVVPRVTDRTAAQPEVAYVGGLITGTAIGTADNGTGMGLMIWPVPSSDVLIDYSYVYRFAELSTDAATWTGVPLEHTRLIESMAFEKLLDSNVEDDPGRASRIRTRNEMVRRRLLDADVRSPVRRVTPELGSGTRTTANPRRRWSAQTVPSPS